MRAIKGTIRLIKTTRVGLGDATAAVIKPVARVIDKVAGTNLANCKGCDGRAAYLNSQVKNVNPFS